MKPTTHWCSVCDARQVDSEKPETGTFYTALGSAWSEKGEWEGEHTSVLFAVCPKCEVKDVAKRII